MTVKPAGSSFLVAWGLLSPLALAVAAGVTAALLFLDPSGPTSPRALATSIRSEPVLTRSRTAALAPLLIVGAMVWLVAVANLARRLLSRGDPAAVGAEVAFASIVLLLVVAAVALAAVAPLRRALALGAGSVPKLVDPVATAAGAAVLVAMVFVWGMRTGDTGGDGGGALGIFGVMRRSELDLRPVLHLLAIATGAYAGPLLVRRRGSMLETLALAVAMLLPLGLVAPAARTLDQAPPLTRAFEGHAPLARIGLGLLRRATDRDRDGASSTFGGGDCDDRHAGRWPGALDVPGNGIDEDCSGADTPLATTTAKAGGGTPRIAPTVPKDLNVVLITIDTLRPELGFLGYDLPVSPNLDRLAEKSAVFERVYAPASYTGKSMAPIMIGKYPSETLRNGSHFNTYEKDNVFLAERLAAANVRTFGAASHWYFLAWSGLTQGFQEFDLSAKPPTGQGDTDTSVTSKELTDAAIKMLGKSENTSGRFFMWVHYIDPHAQYMQHAGAPSFTRPGKTSYPDQQRAAYDAEIWFTDKHVGRLLERIAAAPFADKTAIVVTSDHGEAFAEHNMNWHGIELWESIVRVPLFVYVPGAPPRRIAARRSLIDLVPTIVDLHGLPPPPAGELSGESLIQDVLGTPSPEPRDVYLDMPIGPFNGVRRALITGNGAGTKIVHFGGTHYSVFDLDRDPGELTDLANDPALLQPMVEKLQAFRGRLKEIDVKPIPP